MCEIRCLLGLIPILSFVNEASVHGVDEAVAERAIKMFVNETWYEQQAGKEQLFEGVLASAAHSVLS